MEDKTEKLQDTVEKLETVMETLDEITRGALKELHTTPRDEREDGRWSELIDCINVLDGAYSDLVEVRSSLEIVQLSMGGSV